MLCPCCATAKFIFRQFLLQPDLAQIAKFNDRQYFRIYGISTTALGLVAGLPPDTDKLNVFSRYKRMST